MSVVPVVVVPPSPPQAATPIVKLSARTISDNDERMRPVIGITAYAEEASWGVWKVPAALAPLGYVTKVEQAGGRALLVPPSEEAIDETLDVLDGIVFTGGPDLEPALYDAEPHPETKVTRPDRDRAEIALLAAALERDMPVLAICRGSQVLNVALGGDLEQHVPDTVGHDGHKETPGVFSTHPVAIDEGSRLHDVLGDSIEVSSHHHQGYGRLGEGLIATAQADDGTLEALELPDRSFALGVLWHPEEGDDARLFEQLVAAARDYRVQRLESEGGVRDRGGAARPRVQGHPRGRRDRPRRGGRRDLRLPRSERRGQVHDRAHAHHAATAHRRARACRRVRRRQGGAEGACGDRRRIAGGRPRPVAHGPRASEAPDRSPWTAPTRSVARALSSCSSVSASTAAADRKVRTYSGGMKRRLDLALALVHHPRILFLDEPTTGLDPQSRTALWAEVGRLAREDGVTVFLTTQYLEEADVLADRVGIIDHGRIVAEGTPASLKAEIGHPTVEVEPADPEQRADLERILERFGEVAQVSPKSLAVRLTGDEFGLADVVRALDAEDVHVAHLQLHAPSLDDVFLAKTGRTLEGAGSEQLESIVE